MLRWFMLAMVMFAAVGCGPAKRPGFVVKGNVNLDGAPLLEGRVLFDSSDKKLPSAMATIVGGRYEQRIEPGTFTVRITAEKIHSDKKDKMGMQLREQFIPDKYNAKSTQTITVAGAMEQDFEVKSK